MIRKKFLLATASAIVLLAAGPLSTTAQERAAPTPPAEKSDRPAQPGAAIKADELIGKDIKNVAGETIGDVESVIIDSKGQVAAVIVGVGGFLGMGERAVAIDWGDLKLAASGEAMVTSLSKSDLEARPEYKYKDRSARGTAFEDRDYLDKRSNSNPDSGMKGSGSESMQRSDAGTSGSTSMGGTSTTAGQQAQETEGMGGSPADPGSATTDKLHMKALLGADVLNTNGDTIGQVEDVVIDDQKAVLIVSVGEFLGMGGKSVSLDLDQAQIRRKGGTDDDYEVQISMSKEELQNMPAYKTEESESPKESNPDTTK